MEVSKIEEDLKEFFRAVAPHIFLEEELELMTTNPERIGQAIVDACQDVLNFMNQPGEAKFREIVWPIVEAYKNVSEEAGEQF